MRGRELFGLLERAPLLYETVRQRGSHRKLVSSAGYPTLFLAFHDADEVPPGLVRKILSRDVGLADNEIEGIL